MKTSSYRDAGEHIGGSKKNSSFWHQFGFHQERSSDYSMNGLESLRIPKERAGEYIGGFPRIYAGIDTSYIWQEGAQRPGVNKFTVYYR